MKLPDPKSLAMIGIGLLVPALAARLARSVAGKGYQLLTHEDAPRNPAHPQVEWKEAIIWTVVSGTIGGLARLSARRLLAETIIPAEGDDMEGEVDKLA
ncbi:DUF4235 domain-containing protein [Luteolibacter algae]|uniref:DUF4235 domain-containing protein n=1 Tax=Luteolibacter algae TaxID=454151 RepID=A0ABW5D5Q8_9BACT